MSSTYQRTAADAEVPAEHEAPDELGLAEEFDAATRNQSREPAADVLAPTGRDLPTAVGVRDWLQAAKLAPELGAPRLSPRRSR